MGTTEGLETRRTPVFDDWKVALDVLTTKQHQTRLDLLLSLTLTFFLALGATFNTSIISEIYPTARSE
ncbi:hypothetical protein BT96DRAFT_917684 [Gymnopus androsaceus JB14]|uniref:Uncharacterized protein n=1 Tax=Gymnopus androsaceus JB14 TaxID=1447944 RepID=A0A6A4HVH3_9AGAR|nr:hypothetical protein BT96DRAFT_917684 [Gymnopus androsaceus JB14]